MDILLIHLEVAKNLTGKIPVEPFNKLKNLLKIYLPTTITPVNHHSKIPINALKIPILLITLISKNYLNK
jgi:hypothetical protein